jgi:hypothetical protein
MKENRRRYLYLLKSGKYWIVLLLMLVIPGLFNNNEIVSEVCARSFSFFLVCPLYAVALEFTFTEK